MTDLKLPKSNLLTPKEKVIMHPIYFENLGNTQFVRIPANVLVSIDRPSLTMEVIDFGNGSKVEKACWKPLRLTISSFLETDINHRMIGEQVSKQIKAFDAEEETQYRFTMIYDDFVLVKAWIRNVEYDNLSHNISDPTHINLEIRYDHAVMI